MRKLGLSIALLLNFIVPQALSEIVLSNGHLELVFPTKGEVLLKQITYTTRGIKNLRDTHTNEEFLPFASDDNETGLRVSLGEEDYLRWKIVEQKNGMITLIDESDSVKAQFRLPPDSTAIDVTFTLRQAADRLKLLFLLEVGGGFLGVPTDRPDDLQIVPIHTSKDAPIQIWTSEIPRESFQRYELAAPWWAVADQNINFLLACSAEKLPLSIEQKSQTIGTSDTLRQTLEIPLEKNETSVALQFSLIDGLGGLSGLSSSAAFWLLRDQASVRLIVAPTIPLETGRVVLRNQEAILGDFPIKGWIPGKTYTYDLAVPEWNFIDPLEIEIHAPHQQQHATLFSEK